MDIWQLFEEDEAETQYLPNNGGTAKTSVQRPPEPRADNNLAGLANLGTTCYLNSLIQTMYFTPQLRQRFYDLTEADLGVSVDAVNGSSADTDGRQRKIPLALRRLFARLQLLNQRAVPVGELTAAFGWERNQEIQQHDVQELNRVLFDALEQSLVLSPGEHIIRDMYGGKLVNIVQCLECAHTSRREEAFLDISVPVKGLQCLQQGLAKFTEMEHLSGDNKFRCSGCERLVEAYKGILISDLPPILSINLMRFSYDWNRGTRSKETNEYTFPTSLNMRAYCTEDTQLPEYEYELYSVVLHRGAAHSGHYYAYIRDTYSEGKWKAEEAATSGAKDKKGKNNKAKVEVDFLMCEDPATCIHAILRGIDPSALPLRTEKVTKLLTEKTGQSWHRRFKKSYGPIRQFIRQQDALFLYDPAKDTVTLTDTGFATDVCDPSIGDVDSVQDQQPVLPQWFEVNDETATAIPHSALQRAYTGRDSAYMLFYARKDIFAAATGSNPPVPPQALQKLIAEENAALTKQRDEYEAARNQRTLTACTTDALTFRNHMLTFNKPKDAACVTVAFDQRKPLSSLKAAVAEALPKANGSRLTTLKALDDETFYLGEDVFTAPETTPLAECNVPTDPVLVWNGTIDGAGVKYGKGVVPVRLRVTHFGRNRSEDKQFTLSFLQTTTLQAVRHALADDLALDEEYLIVHRLDKASEEDEDKPLHLSEDLNARTLRDLGMGDRSHISVEFGGRGEPPVAEAAFAKKQTVIPLQLKPSPKAKHSVPVSFERRAPLRAVHRKLVDLFGGDLPTTRMRWLSVDDMLSKTPRLITAEDRSIKALGVKDDDVVSLEAGGLDFVSKQFVLRLKLGPKALAQVPRELRESGTGVPLQHRVWEVMVSKKERVETLQNIALSVLALEGKDWHLCASNWCGEIGEPLNDLKAPLTATELNQNATVFLEHGAVAGKGVINVEVWLNTDGVECDAHLERLLAAATASGSDSETKGGGKRDSSKDKTKAKGEKPAVDAAASGTNADENDTGLAAAEGEGETRWQAESACADGSTTADAGDASAKDEGEEEEEDEEAQRIWCDPQLRKVCTVRVEHKATLLQLKNEVMKLAAVRHVIPSVEHMRLREKVGYRQGRVLRNNESTLKKHKLFNNAGVCVTLLPSEESLKENDLLLKVCVRDPVTKRTHSPQELVFSAQPPSFGSLKQWLSIKTGVPAETLVIARHQPNKGEWSVLRPPASPNTGGGGKKKKKNKKANDNVRQAPYRLRDGDVLAVKDAALDPEDSDTFETAYDRRVKAAYDATVAAKRSERKRRQEDNPEWYGTGSKARSKEVGISIQVPDFASLSVSTSQEPPSNSHGDNA